MKRITLLAAALLATTVLAGAASAKSLVYCSEGSPENFTPAMNTTGTSLDAARPVYNKLVQFVPGGTAVEPGSGRKLRNHRWRQDHHLQAAGRCQVSFRRQRLHPDPRPDRRGRHLFV